MVAAAHDHAVEGGLQHVEWHGRGGRHGHVDHPHLAACGHVVELALVIRHVHLPPDALVVTADKLGKPKPAVGGHLPDDDVQLKLEIMLGIQRPSPAGYERKLNARVRERVDQRDGEVSDVHDGDDGEPAAVGADAAGARTARGRPPEAIHGGRGEDNEGVAAAVDAGYDHPRRRHCDGLLFRDGFPPSAAHGAEAYATRHDEERAHAAQKITGQGNPVPVRGLHPAADLNCLWPWQLLSQLIAMGV